MKQKFLKVIPWVLLGISFGTLMIYQHLFLDAFLSSDDASELVLAHLLATDKSEMILSRKWYYSTEIRVLNAQIIWSILFHFMSSWHWVHLVGNGILVLMLLASLFYLCKKLNIKQLFPILGCFICLPVSDLYYAFILQNVCYIPYVITIVLLLALLFSYSEDKRWYYGVIAVVFSLMNGMGGMRQLLTFYIPLFLATICFFMLDKKKEACSKELSVPIWIFTVMNVAAAGLGYVINSKILSRYFLFAQYENLRFTPFSIERVVNMMNGWLNVLGYKVGGRVFSVATLCNAAAGITFLLLIVYIIKILCGKFFYDWKIRFLAWFYLCGFVAFTLLYAFTDMDLVDRYFLPLSACSYLLIFLGIKEEAGMENKAFIRSIGLCMFSLLIVGNAFFNYYPRIKGYVGNPRKDAVMAAVDAGYEKGFATFWNANISTELSDGALEMWAWTDYPEDIESIEALPQWLRKTSHDTLPDGKVIVLLSQDEAEKFKFDDNFSMDKKVFESDGYIVWGFDSVRELKLCIDGE